MSVPPFASYHPISSTCICPLSCQLTDDQFGDGASDDDANINDGALALAVEAVGP
ncbi:unnamed protein product [Ectocarpus sp. CCAP 1310/34]|nr:unnamed protein product [Ectocarpus sp. CCAP 1310/34]